MWETLRRFPSVFFSFSLSNLINVRLPKWLKCSTDPLFWRSWRFNYFYLLLVGVQMASHPYALFQSTLSVRNVFIWRIWNYLAHHRMYLKVHFLQTFRVSSKEAKWYPKKPKGPHSDNYTKNITRGYWHLWLYFSYNYQSGDLLASLGTIWLL